MGHNARRHSRRGVASLFETPTLSSELRPSEVPLPPSFQPSLDDSPVGTIHARPSDVEREEPADAGPTVHTELPRIDDVPPPPIDLVTGLGEEEADQSPDGTPHVPKSGGGGPIPNTEHASPRPDRNDAQEQVKASAQYIADMATQVIGEMNNYNAKNGTMPVTEHALKLFHFSVKRMAEKYGAAIDEDTYHQLVIVGVGGFVSYNSFRAFRKTKERDAALIGIPVAKEPTHAAPRTHAAPTAPANGSPPHKRDPFTPAKGDTVFPVGETGEHPIY